MIWCSKIQPVSGSERLDLTSLMNMMGSCNAMEWLHIIARINRDQDVGHVVHVLFFLAVWLSEQLVEICGTSLVLRLPRDMHLCRSSSKVPRLPRFLKLLQRPHVLITLDKGQKFGLARNCIWLSKIGSGPSVFNTFDVETCFAPQQRPLFNISKVLWGGHFFSTVDWICASHHNFVHFFNISTSKSAPRPTFDLETCFAPVRFLDISTSNSGPTLVCFVHFDFDLWFAPKRRPPFNILISESGPRPSVFNTFGFEKCFAPQWGAIFYLSFG